MVQVNPFPFRFSLLSLLFLLLHFISFHFHFFLSPSSFFTLFFSTFTLSVRDPGCLLFCFLLCVSTFVSSFFCSSVYSPMPPCAKFTRWCIVGNLHGSFIIVDFDALMRFQTTGSFLSTFFHISWRWLITIAKVKRSKEKNCSSQGYSFSTEIFKKFHKESRIWLQNGSWL